MNDECTYPQVLKLLPLYAIGALEPDKLLAVDAYLQRHQELLAQLRALEEAAVREAISAPAAPMLAHVRQQVVARALADTHSGTALPAPPRLAVRATPSSAQRWLAATCCTLVALCMLGLYSVSLKDQRDQAVADAASAQASIAHMRQTDTTLERQHQDEQHELAIIAGAEQVVALVGTSAQPRAHGTLYMRHGESVLVLQGMPPANSQQTYEVWLVRSDGTPTPLMPLIIHDGGPTMVAITLPSDARAFNKIRVSLEPRGIHLTQPGSVIVDGGLF